MLWVVVTSFQSNNRACFLSEHGGWYVCFYSHWLYRNYWGDSCAIQDQQSVGDCLAFVGVEHWIARKVEVSAYLGVDRVRQMAYHNRRIVLVGETGMEGCLGLLYYNFSL